MAQNRSQQQSKLKIGMKDSAVQECCKSIVTAAMKKENKYKTVSLPWNTLAELCSAIVAGSLYDTSLLVDQLEKANILDEKPLTWHEISRLLDEKYQFHHPLNRHWRETLRSKLEKRVNR